MPISKVHLLAILTFASAANAQIPVGYVFDINGMPIDGYLDPISYQPSNSVKVIYNSDSYEPGSYIDKDGTRHEGLIKFENTRIFFKQGEEVYRDKIKPDLVQSVKIGTDSFFVANNIYYKDHLRRGAEFLQFLTQVDDVVFAKHYVFKKYYPQGSSPLEIAYVARRVENNSWSSFKGSKERVTEEYLKFFSHIPGLEKRISHGDYSEEDAMTLIKMAKYYDSYKKNKTIAFNQHWQELRNHENAAYTATVKNLQDSIWTIAYHNAQNELMFEANLSSFSPNRLEGNFTVYGAHNSVVRQALYHNGKIISALAIAESGDTLYSYSVKHLDSSSTGELTLVKFDNFTNSDNANLEIADITWHDAILEREYQTRLNSNNTIDQVWFQKNGKKIYLTADPNNPFKIKKLEKYAELYLNYDECRQAIEEGVQGTLLVSYVVDSKGYVSGFKLLNSLHPEIDDMVVKHIDNYFSPLAVIQARLKPFKIGKEKVSYEIVVPYEFAINYFYRESSVYFNHMNMFWMHQQMMPPLNVQPPSYTPRF